MSAKAIRFVSNEDDWCEIYVNGEMVYDGHFPAGFQWLDILRDDLGIKVTEEVKQFE